MKTLDTPENWDLAASGYSQKIAPIMMKKYADDFVGALNIEKDHRTLEVAAGSGAITESLARATDHLLATDFSPQMLEELNANLLKAGISHVRTAEMDGQDLDLEDSSFDRTLCSFGLMLFPDRAAGFSELHRVLKPGGRAVVAAWADPQRFDAFLFFMMAMQQAFPEMPKPDSPPPVFSLSDPEQFRMEMTAAGFKDVEVSYVTKLQEIPSFDLMWDMLTAGAPPVRVLFDAVGEDGKMKLKDTLHGIIRERFGDGIIQLSNTATLARGNK